jgi:hypothetical protein
VTLKNTGNGPLLVGGVTTSGPFSQTNGCTGSIVPGQTCTIMVAFTPTAFGRAMGTLILSDNAGTQRVSLVGSGVAPVTLSPSTLRFGILSVGTTSVARTVTLTNRENADLEFSNVAASAGFTVVSNTCGAGLAAGANCVIGLAFSPMAKGAAHGTLTISYVGLTGSQVVTLSGYGL